MGTNERPSFCRRRQNEQLGQQQTREIIMMTKVVPNINTRNKLKPWLILLQKEGPCDPFEPATRNKVQNFYPYCNLSLNFAMAYQKVGLLSSLLTPHCFAVHAPRQAFITCPSSQLISLWH
jgi:hypothetical protein